ncbi:hypothetical protein KYY02_26515 [Streptomyces pimonensis]|uniref:Uncharacterized protein n=1 Tax=Streptomyces pimonensis TaxID=2860288 RepID=A0ABV4J579_9ACTN
MSTTRSSDRRSTITTLLHNAAAAGRIDPALDPDDTTAWIMALIAALHTSAATDPSFTRQPSSRRCA